MLEELGKKASDWLTAEGIGRAQQEIRYEGDFRYYRQGYELHIPIDLAALKAKGLAPLGEQFSEMHDRYYKFRMDIPVEIVNLRAIGVTATPSPARSSGCRRTCASGWSWSRRRRRATGS